MDGFPLPHGYVLPGPLLFQIRSFHCMQVHIHSSLHKFPLYFYHRGLQMDCDGGWKFRGYFPQTSCHDQGEFLSLKHIYI